MNKLKGKLVAFAGLGGLKGGLFSGKANLYVNVPSELLNILNNLIGLLTNKKVVIPATIIAGAIGMYELMFSGTKGGEKLGKALIGGALVLAIASIVKSAFGS